MSSVAGAALARLTRAPESKELGAAADVLGHSLDAAAAGKGEWIFGLASSKLSALEQLVSSAVGGNAEEHAAPASPEAAASPAGVSSNPPLPPPAPLGDADGDAPLPPLEECCSGERMGRADDARAANTGVDPPDAAGAGLPTDTDGCAPELLQEHVAVADAGEARVPLAEEPQQQLGAAGDGSGIESGGSDGAGLNGEGDGGGDGSGELGIGGGGSGEGFGDASEVAAPTAPGSSALEVAAAPIALSACEAGL